MGGISFSVYTRCYHACGIFTGATWKSYLVLLVLKISLFCIDNITKHPAFGASTTAWQICTRILSGNDWNLRWCHVGNHHPKVTHVAKQLWGSNFVSSSNVFICPDPGDHPIFIKQKMWCFYKLISLPFCHSNHPKVPWCFNFPMTGPCEYYYKFSLYIPSNIQQTQTTELVKRRCQLPSGYVCKCVCIITY